MTYRKIAERFIVPHLGRVRLDRLSPQDVRRLLNSCREEVQRGGRNDGQPLSPRTVQMIHAVLRNAIEHAVREELVPRNVVKLVRVAAPQYEVGTGLTVAQARRGHRGGRAGQAPGGLRAGIGDGAAQGRAAGAAVGRRRLGRRRAACPAGLPACRRRAALYGALPLPALAVDALREHRARQAAERLAAGPAWTDSGLVFTTARGTPIEPRNLNRYWYGVRERVGLPGVRLHDLRHTCVTCSWTPGCRRTSSRRSPVTAASRSR